jgi:hypothetical protein
MRSAMELGLRAFEDEDLEALSVTALGASLGEERRAIDRLEADFSRRLARFDAMRGFEASGALDSIAWLRQHGRLSGGAAAERVKVATKLRELPVMAKAFADGELSVMRTISTTGSMAVGPGERTSGWSAIGITRWSMRAAGVCCEARATSWRRFRPKTGAFKLVALSFGYPAFFQLLAQRVFELCWRRHYPRRGRTANRSSAALTPVIPRRAEL